MPPKIYFKDKKCLQCERKFNRGKLKSGREEGVEDFRIRKFCSRKCYFQYNTKEHHWLWKGGIKLGNKDGYLRYTDGTFVHRRELEKFLNRKLKKYEVTHHINGDIKDNRIDNLTVMTNSKHRKLHCKTQKRNRYGFCK